MTLFINTIANDLAGVASFALPDCEGGKVVIDGFLSEDPVISMKNNFDSVISDLSGVNDFMQLADIDTASWMSTTKAAWKGTDPITVQFNFYLLTYKTAQLHNGYGKDLPVSKQAAYFARLLSVTPGGADGQLGSTLRVNVHGGYRPDYYQRNSTFSGFSIANAQNQNYYNGDTSGTCSIIVNGGGRRTLYLNKMLLQDATFTPSTVRTGYWSNNTFITSSEPLYIKVNASFRLMHAATLADATRLFTGNTSI